jgi:hypothetical protein
MNLKTNYFFLTTNISFSSPIIGVASSIIARSQRGRAAAVADDALWPRRRHAARHLHARLRCVAHAGTTFLFRSFHVVIVRCALSYVLEFRLRFNNLQQQQHHHHHRHHRHVITRAHWRSCGICCACATAKRSTYATTSPSVSLSLWFVSSLCDRGCASIWSANAMAGQCTRIVVLGFRNTTLRRVINTNRVRSPLLWAFALSVDIDVLLEDVLRHPLMQARLMLRLDE